MNQGLLNWLNAVNHDEENSEQIKTGLLLAPINDIQHIDIKDSNPIHEINEPVHDEPRTTEIQIHESEPEPQTGSEPEHEPIYEHEPTHANESIHEHEPVHEHEPESEQEHESESEQEQENEPQELHTLIGIPEGIEKENVVTEAEAITRELQSLKDAVDSIAERQQDTTRGLDLNKAWHEANAGLELSMKEPPPQIWTSHNEPDDEDENESEDYEHIILQQNSSVTLHGTNFTQRLQKILQGRKNKAAELKRKSSEDNKHSHSYIKHAFMMCSAMLLTLGLVWLSVMYLQTKTPDGFNRRASELYEQGKYEEAMNLWQEAYNRYPNVLTFLTGIARSAEKAGHSQTANIAWNEYQNALPKDTSEDIEPQRKHEPLKININTGGDKKTGRTFDEYLNEGNRAFNIGMYNLALMNFFHALEMRNDDIRPYIGIAESYRAKGMYFDAKRILDEARIRFGINPSIEAAKEFLKGSN